MYFRSGLNWTYFTRFYYLDIFLFLFRIAVPSAKSSKADYLRDPAV